MGDWLSRHPGAWRAPLALVAAVLAVATILMFGFGACDGDDFLCSDDEFVLSYAIAAGLGALSGAAFAALSTTRRRTIGVAALATGGAVALLAVVVELLA